MLGLSQACRNKAKINKQLGAKFPDRDFGDVHTWPHSHYLMRQCDGVGGWVQLKYGCVGAGVDAKMCRYKKMRNMRVQNQESDEGKRLPSLSYIFHGSNPFFLLILLFS